MTPEAVHTLGAVILVLVLLVSEGRSIWKAERASRRYQAKSAHSHVSRKA